MVEIQYYINSSDSNVKEEERGGKRKDQEK